MVREIVKRLGNSVEKQTPPPRMLEDRRQFDDHLPVLFRRLSYSVGNYIASNEVRQILSTRPVVMDRLVLAIDFNKNKVIYIQAGVC